MGNLIFLIAWLVVKILQALPLQWGARLGRAGGVLAYALDGRHRRVAIKNLTQCFGQERSPAEIRAIARETFQRIGENYCCSIRTAAMSWAELKSHIEMAGPAWLTEPATGSTRRSRVVAVGHFGNFEIYARLQNFNPAYQIATTYRGLQPPALNRLLQSLREKSGCLYFERRTDLKALKAWMAPQGRLLGFLADQHAGRSGVRAPFFGLECATTAAPVVFALRYSIPLCVGICYRTAIGHWRIEISDDIPTHEQGRPRSIEAITVDINRAFETAIRRDPANWFWVHNRWKPDKLPPLRPQRTRPAAAPAVDP